MRLKPKPFQFIPVIPWWWAVKASSLPGKASFVGQLIWLSHKVSLGHKPPIPFSRRYYANAGISRVAVRHGITHLEKAGLIQVTKGKNKAPRISIITQSEYRTQYASFKLEDLATDGEDPLSQINLEKSCTNGAKTRDWIGCSAVLHTVAQFGANGGKLWRLKTQSRAEKIIGLTKQETLEERDRECEELDRRHGKLGARCPICDGELDREECEAFHRSLRRDD